VIRVLGEPFGHVTVASVDGHDGRELDECGAQGCHDRLPTAQLTAVGVVQQKEAVVPVVVGGVVVVAVAGRG